SARPPTYTRNGPHTNVSARLPYSTVFGSTCPGSAAGVLVDQPPALEASETHDPIACFGGTTTVNITASGGTPPYAGDGAHTNVSAGPFDFTVTDHNGCVTHVTGNISQPSAVTLSLSVTACSSGSNGSIMATFGGGTGPYQVKMDAGSFAPQTSPYTFTGLAPGSHTITIEDANLCTAGDSISVPPC